ncbi:MAG: FtsW/RodA/SpoVE family cell cycle protein [Minisyncoccia bacterium]
MLSLFLPVGIIMVAGLVTLAALSPHLFLLQLLWIGFGAAIVVFFLFFDWRAIFNARWAIAAFYGFTLLLMVFLLVHGQIIRNARSWIVIGPLSLQPVELMKAALIFLYAMYFQRRHLAVARLGNILTSFVFFLLPAAIAVRLPDLGSALIFFGIWFGFLLLLGLPWRRVLMTVGIFFVAGIFVWSFVLKGYHRARVIGFLYPEQNALGVNYSVTQSRIAIGSAGFWGKGFGQGTQAELGFLSVPTADFIFASFIEEWGIFGGLVVIAAFFFLIWRILAIGSRTRENFAKCVCLGVAIMLSIQFFLNAGSVTGILPVIGVTFPFLSYGGTSMVVDCFLLAVVNSVRKQS